MIQEPLSESHVTCIFIHNIHPKLNFIALDYMTLPFTEIMHRLVQKEKCLVDIGKLKYGNPLNETKRGGYKKNEYKEVYAVEDPQNKEKTKLLS